MLHWFLWLWFDQELPSEANLLLVVCSHLEELAHVVELSPHVCVEQTLVALTTSPEHCRKIFIPVLVL